MMSKRKKWLIVVIVAVMCVLITAIVLMAMFFSGRLNAEHRLFHEADEGDIRVACVGDSITYGSLIFGWPYKAYPEVLGKKLGEGYTVNNYGQPGSAAQFAADKPYVEMDVYQMSIDFEPNIVIIMLGSNDTRSANRQGIDNFKADYSALIDIYINLPSVWQVYIMTPPPAYKYMGKVGYSIDATLLETKIRPTVIEIAEEKNLVLIDLFEMFSGKKKLFADGVHPNAKGAQYMAQAVYDAIQANTLAA